MAEVKLHGNWSSPFTYRVIWALALKGIPYEYVEEDLTNKSPLLLQYNPVHKKVPVLVHGGKRICESSVILEYIDETWPQNFPLLPADPLHRAAARFWIRFVEDKGSAVWRMFCSRGKEHEKAKRESLEMLRMVEEQGIGEGKFFGGEKMGMVDLAYGLFGEWLGVIEEVMGEKLIETETFPRLQAWRRAFMEAPVIRENLPDRERMVATFKHLRENVEMAEVKLHGAWPSPFSYRVIWALKLKGIPYEYVEEDLANKSPLLLHYNPVHEKIPVLVHGGKPICESTIILEYIDDTWPQKPLLPTDPLERATARFWIKFIEEKDSTLRTIFLARGEEREKARRESLEVLRTIEERGLGGEKFFGGEEINMVDLAFGWIAGWLKVLEEVVDMELLEGHGFPRLEAWAANFRGTAVIKDNIPDHDQMVLHFRRRREELLQSVTK